MADSKPILGYWDIRGLAAPIRYLLAYCNVDYVDKHYKCGPPPTFARDEWLNEKFNLGLDFPNLPYYIHGNVKLSQSGAILRHIARTCCKDMCGKTPEDMNRVDLAEAQVRDYHMDFVRVVYNPEFLKLKEDYVKSLPDKLKALTKFLGDRKFVAGDYVTYVDFCLFEYLEVQSYLVEGLLKDFPELEQFHQRVAALPSMVKYFESPGAIKYPFNGAPALFGGAFSDQLTK